MSPSARLSVRETKILEKHRDETEGVVGVDSTVEQWEGHFSTFRASTGKLWVYRLRNGRKVAKQELFFYSAKSVVGTLTCSHPVKLHDRRRKLTPRETARLQGFPEDMILPVQACNRLFGNAVCVPCAAFAIARVCRYQERLRHLDVCSGIGGFSFALREACPSSWSVGFSEVFRPAERCYVANFPNTPRLGDATLVTSSPPHGGPGWPQCDLFTAGFPCQPFSACNTLIAREDHAYRDFYRVVLRAIEESGATRVVLENVVAFFSDARFEEIVGFLRERDFHVSRAVLDSADFGVPQRRKRMYVMASKVSPPLETPLPSNGTTRTLADILDED